MKISALLVTVLQFNTDVPEDLLSQEKVCPNKILIVFYSYFHFSYCVLAARVKERETHKGSKLSILQ